MEPEPTAEAKPPRQRKPSWVDRPKPPKDWRWWVGGTGRVLIVTGVLMFLFVGYQLWGTGLQTARAQDRLEDEFEQMLADAATSTVPEVVPGDTTPTSVPDSIPDSVPGSIPDSIPGGTVPSTTSGAAPPSTAPPSTTAPRSPSAAPSRGKPLARLEIPRLGRKDYVVQGVSMSNLKNGPGHFPETPMPGQLGNSAIAGHRTTYGAPFGNLDRLRPGDQIIATTVSGRYVYQVTGSAIVGPNDYSLAVPTRDWTTATLTLITCDPKYTAKNRLVVYSRLVASESAPVSEWVPPATTAPPVTQPPTTRPPATQPPATQPPSGTLPGETLPGDTLPADTVPPDTLPSDTLPPDTQPVDTEAPVDTSPEFVVPFPDEADDAFSEGWFADTAAWPHVAAWGAVLALVAIGAYWVARLARRRYVGALVGFAPFFVVLYFWFENINRLLPPGL